MGLLSLLNLIQSNLKYLFIHYPISLFKINLNRIMKLEAPSGGQHRLWLNGLIEVCPYADTSGVTSEIKALTNRQQLKGVQLIKEDRGYTSLKNDGLTNESKNADEDEPEMKSDSSQNSASTGERRENKLREKERDKSDHRLQQYPRSGKSSTERLHGHIRKDSETNQVESKVIIIKSDYKLIVQILYNLL